MSMAKKSPTPASNPKDALRIRESDYAGKTVDRMEAELAQSPVYANAQTARTFSRGTFGVSGLTESVEALRDKVERVRTGSLSDAEAMLVSQATALDAIFTEMARRSALNMGEYLNSADTYMRLALRAQSQCRTTLEALAEIKNPRAVAFVKQANIAHGHQQVNNGLGESPAHGNHSIQSNELLEAQHGNHLDSCTAGAAIGANSELATVGQINRATD